MWTPEVEEALYTKQYWNILIEAQTAISFMNEAHESYRPLGGEFWLSLPTLGKLTKLFTFWSNHHPGFMTDFQSLAVLALQKASEAYLVALSSNTPICVPFTQNVSPSCPRISSCWLEGSKKRARKSHLAKAFGVRIREVRL